MAALNCTRVLPRFESQSDPIYLDNFRPEYQRSAPRLGRTTATSAKPFPPPPPLLELPQSRSLLTLMSQRRLMVVTLLRSMVYSCLIWPIRRRPHSWAAIGASRFMLVISGSSRVVQPDSGLSEPEPPIRATHVPSSAI
ncbi:hypothetical protein U1Q18_018381 [Sarracenia purpurea var. burkii]